MFHQPTFDAMIRHGDTFDRKLAKAWRVASDQESRALLRAFPERFGAARIMADTIRGWAMVSDAGRIAAPGEMAVAG